jgi:hypothetical protein
VQRAFRHVREGEQRVARQRQLLEQLIRDRHVSEVEPARQLLAALERSVSLARDHLRHEEEEQDVRIGGRR